MPVSFDAGWSSLVARRAHNPKVVGSNPAPATIFIKSPFNPLKISMREQLFFFMTVPMFIRPGTLNTEKYFSEK